MPKYDFAFFNLAAIILLGFVFYLTKKSKNKDKNAFTFLIILSLLSNIIYLGYEFSSNLTVMKISLSIILMLEGLILLSLLAFINSYTGHKRNIPISTIIIVLVILDMISIFVNIFTNHAFDFKVIIRDNFEYLLIDAKWPYILHQVLCYSICTFVLMLLIHQFIIKPAVYKIRYSTILFCILIIVFVNSVAYIGNLRIDPTIFMYSLADGCIYYLSFKYTPRILINQIQSLIIEEMNDILVIFDNYGKLLYINERAKEFIGVISNDINLKDIEYFCKQHVDRFNDSLLSLKQNKQNIYFDIETKEINDYKKRLQAIVYIFHDVTLRETEKRLRSYETSHDYITGIFNRRYFLEQANKIYQNYEDKYAILATNFEGFRIVNEMLGVGGGNHILKRIGDVLTEIDKEIGIIYGRMEGDKFAILVKTSKLDSCLKKLQEKIHEIIKRTPLTLKIGIAYVLDDSIEAAYDNAIKTLHYIANDFSKMIGIYDEKVNESNIRSQNLLLAFDEAIKNHQFLVYLQPQINSYDDTIVGAEALIRWKHPKYGMIPPSEFIPLFEKNMIINRLDAYVWEEACRFLKKWDDEEHKKLCLSVNISTKDFYLIDVVSTIIGLKDKYQIDSSRLKLEITESAFVNDQELLIKNVVALQKAGFVVEMDDFGSGYSSFNSLKDIPIDVLKLDMKFLAGDIENKKAYEILTSVISMAHRISLPVIAEGVETKAQCDLLREADCDLIQGYYYSKPLPMDDFESFMETRNLTSFISFWTKSNENKEIYSIFKEIHRTFNNSPLSVLIVGPSSEEKYRDNMTLYYINPSYIRENGINPKDYSLKTLDEVFGIKKEEYMPKLLKILNDSRTYSLNTTLSSGRKAHINAYSLKNRYISILITYLDEDDSLD